jgi:hypothetical protein
LRGIEDTGDGPRPPRGARIAALLFVLGSVSPASARAGQACGARGEPVVRIVAAPFDAAFRAALATQLAAGLSARHLELCVDEGLAVAAVVASEVAFSGSPAVAVTVTVRDAITGKLVAREVDLRTVPVDARALTLALAVDELLRASWVELTLADAPRPTRPVPREIGEAVAASFERTAGAPTARRWQVGAALAAERFGGGSEQAGLDVAARVSRQTRLGLEGTVGLRREAAVHAPDGTARGTAVEAALDAAVVLAPWARRWDADLLAGARGTRLEVSGDPRAGAHGRDVTATALYLDVGLRAGFRVTLSFGLSLTARFGVPVHAVDILDGDTRIAGLSGPLLALALGGWWRFP